MTNDSLKELALERELEEIEISLLGIVFKKYRRGVKNNRKMKRLGIMNAREAMDMKNHNFYMCFSVIEWMNPEEEDEIGYYFDPRYMLRCSLDEKINIVYHEMLHYLNYLAGIKDTKGHYHTKDFRQAARANMGDCLYIDSELGYIEAYLLPEALAKVKKDLEDNLRTLEQERERRKTSNT